MVRRALFSALFLVCQFSGLVAQERVEHSLDGSWQLQVDGEQQWRVVDVPGTFESQINIDFDGVATYRKFIDPIDIGPHRRLLLHFDAVATQATVWFNGRQVGEHLGGWTPFRFDVTDAAKLKPDGPWEIKVRVDELVGHNTQGFLPIIAPHFGGIWQRVRLMDVPVNWIDDLKTRARLVSQGIHVDLPVTYSGALSMISLSVRELGTMQWQEYISLEDVAESDHWEYRIVPFETSVSNEDLEWQMWSPSNPKAYEIKIEITVDETTDSIVLPLGFRDLRVKDNGFVLNGKPMNFRGLLNWGYSPPRNAPSLDEEFMRKEIRFAKDRGFNLMKFCLWIPPKRYLELCDEMGMMAWIEYPTWHPDFSEKHLEDLKAEYDEFFYHDRNHPSVVLRSLTCETGPSADLKVIRELYDQCKERIPGAVVVDDSSWIAWNRVFDFYDDHPYGNNHTWVDELTKLKQFIAEREPKPLMLGEAIAADTWTDPSWFRKDNAADDHWQPNFLEPSRQWLVDVAERYANDSADRLLEESKTYAMLMRKYQMETFRREVPDGGYVVSVIRDMPLAAMGLIDYNGEPKWHPEEWTWHGDRMLLLETKNDRRSFFGGELFEADLIGAGFERQDVFGRFHVTITPEYAKEPKVNTTIDGSVNRTRPIIALTAKLPGVDSPEKFILQVTTTQTTGGATTENEWPIWIVPQTAATRNQVCVHPSAAESANNVLGLGEHFELISFDKRDQITAPATVLTSVIDKDVIAWLSAHRPVVLLANNQPNSFPLQSHWFLRGGPVIAPMADFRFRREMLVHLQHFDLAMPVIRDIKYMDAIDPLFMLWEAHDLDHIKTNGLLFHMPVGESGNLFVSALKHDGETNAAGSYVLQTLIEEMTDGGLCVDLADSQRGKANLERLTEEIQQRKIMLDQRQWKFQPDSGQQGREALWFAADHDDSSWPVIRIDRSWESQGHDQLDNWAWYRLQVDVPNDWNSQRSYLNFTGVDDYYDVYVNGHKVGSGGNIEKRETAFELRTSHDITDHINPGEPLQITVAVYDWYGAGGIFRPVWISSQPISDLTRMLK